MKGILIIIAVMCIMLAALFHILFIVIDYSYFNPDDGAFTRLQEIENETLKGDFRDRAYANNVMLREFFGYGRIILIGACLVVVGFAVLDSKEGG